jgi:hypothetical protein
VKVSVPISVAEADAAIPTLCAALSAVDAQALSAHVAFPRPHTPFPLEGTFMAHREPGLNKIHKALSTVLLTNGIVKQHDDSVQPDHPRPMERVSYQRTVLRSLSCAVEYFIAAKAKAEPEATAEQFVQDLRLDRTPIPKFETIVKDWSLRIAQSAKELVQLNPQTRSRVVTLEEAEALVLPLSTIAPIIDQAQPDDDLLEPVATTSHQQISDLPDIQAAESPLQPTQLPDDKQSPSQDVRWENEAQPQQDLPYPSSGTVDVLMDDTDIVQDGDSHSSVQLPQQQDDHRGQPSVSSPTAQIIMSVNGLVPANVNEGTLPVHAGVVRKRQPQAIPSQYSYLLCLPEQLRQDTVTVLYQNLKKHSVSRAERFDHRIFNDQIYQLARQIESDILVRFDKQIKSLPTCPTSEEICMEYDLERKRQLEMYKEVEHFLAAVKTLQMKTARAMKKARNIVKKHGLKKGRPTQSLRKGRDLVKRHAHKMCYSSRFFQPNGAYHFRPAQRTPHQYFEDEMDTSDIFDPDTKSAATQPPPPQPPMAAPLTQEDIMPDINNLNINSVAPPPPPPQTSTQAPRIGTTPNPPAPSILTSDKLTHKDLHDLKQLAAPTPENLNLADDMRSDTIVDFFDTMTEVNDKIARMKQGLEMDLIGKCMENGSPVFWNDFIPLSPLQIASMARHWEGIVVQQLQAKVAAAKVKTPHVIEYGKLAAKSRIAADAKGIERFAGEVERLRGQGEGAG